MLEVMVDSSIKAVVAEAEGPLDMWGRKAFIGPPSNRLGSAIAKLALAVFHSRQHHQHSHSAIHHHIFLVPVSLI
jgi:hypothetical protein